MTRDSDVNGFVQDLAATPVLDDSSVNLYEEEIRRKNLVRWINSFDAEVPAPLFVGEAPGTSGARITGVPFTSPNLLMTNHDPWGAFGPDAGYEIPADENPSQREQAATVFWKHVFEHLSDLPRPLTWNAVPFWPRRRHENRNRTPSIAEVRYGSEWVRRIVDLHPNALVVAVGRSAEYALRYVGVDHIAVRHPVHGGAQEFGSGLVKIADMLRG